MGNESSSSASSSGLSSTSASSGSGSQYTQARNDFLRRHADIMDKLLKYDVYLIRNEGVHHFLILQSEEKQACIRVELTQECGKTIFLHSDYKGTLKSEDHRGQIEMTLKNVLDIGKQIIRDYKEEYKLLEQNCQEFCNTYLIKLGLNGYITYSFLVKVGMAVVVIWNGIRGRG